MNNILSNAFVTFLIDDQLSIYEKIESLDRHILLCSRAVKILSGQGIMSPEYLIASMREVISEGQGSEDGDTG